MHTPVALRPEEPGDEQAIHTAVTRAFASADEANLVTMLRQRQPGFDPELSICAWDGDELVGYLAAIPLPMRLMGGRVPAAALAPVCVITPRQGEGIGGQMLRYVHDRARERGIWVIFLNGHPGYYPRHGYTACFGFAHTTYDASALPAPSLQLEAWPVREEDIPWLVACDEREWRDVDFTWPRGFCLNEWAIEGVNGVVWRTLDGRRAAYTLTRAGARPPGLALEVILGDDPELVREVLFRQKPARSPNHPAGWLARAVLDPAWATCEASAGSAALAIELKPGVLGEYMAARGAGTRLPGACNWPVPFLMC